MFADLILTEERALFFREKLNTQDPNTSFVARCGIEHNTNVCRMCCLDYNTESQHWDRTSSTHSRNWGRADDMATPYVLSTFTEQPAQ